MAKRLIVLDYNAVRKAFDDEFKATRKLIESGETHLDNLAEGFTEADRVLRKLSAVDAVEVVRCKDCKHYKIPICEVHSEYPDQYTTGHTSYMEPDDFCSYGERKGGQAPQREDV